MNRIQKFLIATVLTLTLLVGSSAMAPWVPMSLLTLGATPSSQRVPNVTTTSATVFVQTGWNRLTCSSDVYYLLVSASTSAVTSSTGTLLRGPAGSNGLPMPAWILVSSNQWLALLLRSGTTTQCVVETVSLDGSAGSFTTLAVSSTSAFTGQATFSGFVQGTDAGFNNLVDTGNLSTLGTGSVGGALTSGGVISGIFDGGAYVGTTLNLSSTATVGGSLTATGDNIIASTKTRGNCTLNNASPSVCTATVNTGAICVCANNTTAANGVKCAVSSTTLTVTGPNTTTDVVSYVCLQ